MKSMHWSQSHLQSALELVVKFPAERVDIRLSNGWEHLQPSPEQQMHLTAAPHRQSKCGLVGCENARCVNSCVRALRTLEGLDEECMQKHLSRG